MTPADNTKFRIARDPGTIEQTASQIDNYTVRPEWFVVRRYSDPIAAPFHGQSQNDAEAEKRTREREGSVRAQGDVNHAGPSHTV